MSATISATRTARGTCGCGCGCRSCSPRRGASAGLRELEYEYELETELEAELESELEFEAQREIIGRDTRVLVRNTRAAPFRYICNLVANNDTEPFCTGTLVAPNVVLTAAHCLIGLDAADVTVIPGRNGVRRPFGTARALRFAFSQGFQGNPDRVTRRDYAVIYLTQPIGNTVGHWSIAHTSSRIDPLGTSFSAAPVANGQQINLSGYPGDKVFMLPNPPRRVAQQWRARNVLRAIDQNGLMHYLNDTFGGHSGSPIWIKRRASLGGRVMIGLHLDRDDLGTAQPTTPLLAANRGLKFTQAIIDDIRRLINGAPPVQPVQPPPVRTRILDRFQFDRPGVQPQHRPIIEEIARAVVASAGTPNAIHTIRIVGHADSSGSDTYNLNLGQQRAIAVQRELVAAIDRLRPGHSRTLSIVPQSLGESRPIADNRTPDGQARNRRVEVTLVGR